MPGIRAAQAGDELGGGADQLVDGVEPTGGQVLAAIGSEEIGQRAVSDLELGVETLGGKQALGLTVVIGVEVAIGKRRGGFGPVSGPQERPELTGISLAQGAKLGRSRVDRGVERAIEPARRLA